MDVHPLVIHFPIVLIPLSALCDMYGLWRAEQSWHRVAYSLLIGGVLASALAVLTGNAAAASHWGRAGVDPILSTHENWATATLLGGLALVLGRLPLHLRQAAHGRRLLPWTLGALLASAFVGAAAYYGGILVYEHGVGVRGG